MKTKTVHQTDRAGMYLGPAIADESPLEPGLFHLPAGAVEITPPEDWPEDKWPRWNGSSWELTNKPQPALAANTDPVAKLQAFLLDNPDVAALLNNKGDE